MGPRVEALMNQIFKCISVTGRNWNIKHRLCSIVLAAIIWEPYYMSLIKRLFIQVSSCLLVYQSGSFTFLREDIHLWIGEGSDLTIYGYLGMEIVRC